MEDKIIAEEAAGWLVRMEEDPSEQCQAQFTAWLEKSPRSMEEFLLVTAAYRELDGVDAAREMDVEELVEEMAGKRSADVVELGKPRPTLPVSSRMQRKVNMKTTLAAAAAVGAIAILGWLVLPLITAPIYQTATGEQRAVKLGDGSVVQLNTQSQVQVRFSDSARDVQLVQGEALFVVEKDAKRPFRVVTETSVIQALGTQFNVYQHGGTTTVSVLDGLVRIENAQGRQDLAAGEAARIAADGRIKKEAKPEVAKAVAWRQRKLDFRGTPLSQVAAEFNRYNELQIQVEDSIAGQKQLNGVFNADEPQSLLKFLEQDPALQVEHGADRLIVRAAR